MTARVSHIFDIALRAVLALVLASILALQALTHPQKADAFAPAVPVAFGVGSAIATALGCYGIYVTENNVSVEDIGSSFISWISSKSLDDFWDKQTDIKSAQAAINSIYQVGVEGSLNLADWTYNEQNAITGAYGELLQLWAADGFAASPPDGSTSTVTIGDFSFGTFYSAIPFEDIVGFDSPYVSYSQPPLGYILTPDGEVNFVSYSSAWHSDVIYGIALASDGVNWALFNTGGYGANSSLNVTNYFTYDGSDTCLLNSANSSSPLYGVDISSFHFNTYYSLYFSPSSWNGVGNPSSFSASRASTYYDASLDLWSGDVSIDSGIEGSLFDKFSDALNQGINDLLQNNIPLGADYVYNPSTQALEQQGSVPVVTDWSNIADWAGLLERLRAGLLDGTNVISNDTTGARANTIDDTIVDDDSIPDWPDDPWKTPNEDINTIGAALAFTGESISRKFPFSTWGDVVAISHILSAPASAPEFDLPIIGFNGSGFSVERVHISLAQYEPVAIVVRLMFLILMILAVVWLAVRQLKVFAE